MKKKQPWGKKETETNPSEKQNQFFQKQKTNLFEKQKNYPFIKSKTTPFKNRTNPLKNQNKPSPLLKTNQTL